MEGLEAVIYSTKEKSMKNNRRKTLKCGGEKSLRSSPEALELQAGETHTAEQSVQAPAHGFKLFLNFAVQPSLCMLPLGHSHHNLCFHVVVTGKKHGLEQLLGFCHQSDLEIHFSFWARKTEHSIGKGRECKA